jgi:hypothetical protein
MKSVKRSVNANTPPRKDDPDWHESRVTEIEMKVNELFEKYWLSHWKSICCYSQTSGPEVTAGDSQRSFKERPPAPASIPLLHFLV